MCGSFANLSMNSKLTSVIRWVAGKISEILKAEDDVVIELCFNLIESSRYVRIGSRLSTSKLTCATARYQEATDSTYWFLR